MIDETTFVYEYQPLQTLEPTVDEGFRNQCRGLMSAGLCVLYILWLLAIFSSSVHTVVVWIAGFVMVGMFVLALILGSMNDENRSYASLSMMTLMCYTYNFFQLHPDLTLWGIFFVIILFACWITSLLERLDERCNRVTNLQDYQYRYDKVAK